MTARYRGMVAERIVRFAKLVPDASLAFAKLYALAEGDRLATRELWGCITSDSKNILSLQFLATFRCKNDG